MNVVLQPGAVWVLAILVVVILLSVALIPVWMYHRGASHKSPLPKSLERLIEPPNYVLQEKIEWPEPKQPCDVCTVVDWKISADESEWECQHCGRAIDGPRPKVKA